MRRLGVLGFHSLYRKASFELISFVDHNCGHGVFRNWASFTRSALEVLGGDGALTREVAANAFTCSVGRTMPPDRPGWHTVVADSLRCSTRWPPLSGPTSGWRRVGPSPGLARSRR